PADAPEAIDRDACHRGALGAGRIVCVLVVAMLHLGLLKGTNVLRIHDGGSRFPSPWARGPISPRRRPQLRRTPDEHKGRSAAEPPCSLQTRKSANQAECEGAVPPTSGRAGHAN